MPPPLTENTLFYGDNLTILRDYFPDESVDLIYLDPPFNSSRSYNVLFKDESGSHSEAQITAFEDTWHWNIGAEQIYTELVTQVGGSVAAMIGALRSFVGTNQMMAYLVMMAARLVELHRVLKPTGSIYLHCDPTASHYLKIVMDTIFLARNFRNEIVWKRSAAHGGAVSFNDVHDIVLYYSKDDRPVWNPQRVPYDESYIQSHYSLIDEDGRRYQLVSAHGAGEGPPRRFGDKMIDPPPGRHWMSQEHIDEMMAQGKVVFTKSGMPRYKRYLDDSGGIPLNTVWDDIPPVNSQASERMGYPTQKPLALLERIIQASSNEGDLVLDPFCGCGTAVVAAHRLHRRWVGIDITHLAVALNKYRLEQMFPGLSFKVQGEPQDLAAARHLASLNRHQFEWWALSLVHARPGGATGTSKKGRKGADKGIDGIINFIDDASGKPKRILVQVKSGKVGSKDIRDLVGTIQREQAQMGLFLTLENPTGAMEQEAASAGFYQSEGWGRNYPAVQILTIEGLLQGTRPTIPPPHGTFKTIQRANQNETHQNEMDV